MSSLLFINQFYYPDCSATSQLLEQLAEGMARRGFEVTVLTGNTGCEGGRLSDSRKEVHEHVSIIRVLSTRFGKSTTIGRLTDYLTFYISVLVRVLFLRRFDVVVVLTTPPLIAWVGSVAQTLKGSRFIYWVQDLYPEIAAALGALKADSLTYRTCALISRRILHAADATVAVGEDMASKLSAGNSALKEIRVIHNWADEGQLKPVEPSRNTFLQEQALADKLVILYAGNFGLAHEFDLVLRVAKELKDDPEIVFVFVGSGKRRGEIEEAIRQNHLSNVRLLPSVPLERLQEVLSAASIGLVTERPEVEGLMVPSKVYGLMATARPILFLGPIQSDCARIVQKAQCGLVVAPHNKELFLRSIRDLQNNRQKGEKMGQSGRQWFLRHYSKSVALGNFAALFDKILTLWAPMITVGEKNNRAGAASSSLPAERKRVS
ncbi:MAG: glycosyltransferase family 4 protein [Acidobacteriia bacterium]|nr:glycosyltransferase family 4 protein [Terriglobia bacterium]